MRNIIEFNIIYYTIASKIYQNIMSILQFITFLNDMHLKYKKKYNDICI